jgi:HSP20 family protein
MSSIARWDPFRELEELQHRYGNIFGRSPIKKEGEKREALTVADWAPLVDIVEDDKEYLIKAEIPGMNKEDIKVGIQDDVLTISGERRYEKEEKDKKFHRIERAHGSFARSFTIPEDSDGEKISAEFKDGILNVRLPKTARVKPKHVEVKVG